MTLKDIVNCQQDGIKQAVSNAVDMRTIENGALLDNVWEVIGERIGWTKRLKDLCSEWKRAICTVDASFNSEQWPDYTAVAEGIKATKAFISGLLGYTAFLCAVHVTTRCLRSENIEKELIYTSARLEGRVNKRIRFRKTRPDA